ncbi:hypothetical protein SRB17_86760 [Streptomyces sp. RB17]|uniref:MaoC family dehydratase n=1 Tax=Streptomyces sp. RB17 TaxID=2585197 RepID=UPI00129532A2|nr:MaoC family dehydratase [Streptomyces sp. RB17]MQY40643.1 hypothetical protein [Streptomyces sp. RB17]
MSSSHRHEPPVKATTPDTTPAPVNPDGLWLDDLVEGRTFRSQDYEVSEAEIIRFASQYDPQRFHLNDGEAQNTFFGGLAGSGWHTAAITMRLLATSVPIATGIVGSDIHLKWPSATRPGDILHVEATIKTATASASRPERGSIVLEYDTVNQHGDVRQRTTGRIIVWRRPADMA